VSWKILWKLRSLNVAGALLHRSGTPKSGPVVNLKVAKKKVERMYRVGQKRGHRLMTIFLSILYRFKKFIHWKIPW